jgi:hypothetical protein
MPVSPLLVRGVRRFLLIVDMLPLGRRLNVQVETPQTPDKLTPGVTLNQGGRMLPLLPESIRDQQPIFLEDALRLPEPVEGFHSLGQQE